MPVDDCERCEFAENKTTGEKLCGAKLYGKDKERWFSFGIIRYCRVQMMWLIGCLVEGDLDREHWPQNPQGSSYVDVPINKKVVGDEAYFIKPTETIAEIMTRLKRAKQDGQTLMEEIHSGLHEYNLLSRVAKNALNYISIYDWRKRKLPYSVWKAQRKYYKNIAKGNLTSNLDL